MQYPVSHCHTTKHKPETFTAQIRWPHRVYTERLRGREEGRERERERDGGEGGRERERKRGKQAYTRQRDRGRENERKEEKRTEGMKESFGMSTLPVTAWVNVVC